MQFLDILSILPSLYTKVLFLLLLSSLSLWVYVDSERRNFTGILWAIIIFLYPIILPVYLIIRPKAVIEFCSKCRRILPAGSKDCYFCSAMPVKGKKEDYPLRGFFRSYGYHFFLVIFRTLHNIAGLPFLYKKRFFPLILKLAGFYKVGKVHQIVITEGSKLDIPIKALTYGETSFYSAWKIFRFAGLSEKDVFYDLGCGTGNLVFFASILYGIEAVGIEAIPAFIDFSEIIKKELSFDKVSFIKGNFFEEDLSQGTVFFIVTIFFSVRERKKLAKKFKELPSGTKIITVSNKLEAPYLKVKEEMTGFFSWGFEDVYLHVRI